MSPCPAPEISVRLATDDEIPLAARRVRKLAEANGWTVFATYARGPLIAANGRVLRTVSSTALRMARGWQGTVAIWYHVDDDRWTFETAYAWTAGQRFFPARLSAADLRRHLGSSDADTR